MDAVLALLVGLAALLLAMWAFRRVENLVSLLFLASLLNGLSFPVGPAVVRLDAIITVPILVITALSGRRSLDPGRRRWFGCAAFATSALLMVALASSSSALEPVRSLFMLSNFAIGSLAFLTLVRADLDWHLIVTRTTWALAAISTVSLVELLVAPGASLLTALPQGGDGYRVRGLALEPNLMATMCAAWLGVMYYWRAGLGKSYLFPAAVLAIACVLTNTRAAWISLALLAIFALWQLRARLVIVVPATAAVLFAVVVAIGPSIQSSERGSLGWKLVNVLAGDTGTGLYRVRTWEIAFEDLDRSDSWWWGLGANSYAQRHPVDLTGATEGYLSNVWIGWVYDAGLIGLVCFVIMLVAAFMMGANRVDSIPTFAAVLISASFTNPFWMVFPWIMLAASIVPVARGRLRRAEPFHAPTVMRRSLEGEHA